MSAGLEGTYRAYVDALNARRFDELGRYVHDRLTYNGEPWTLEDYRARLVDDVRSVADLHYVLDRLVVGPDTVAARLSFDCTPRGLFLGVETDGRRVRFAEHVFYGFREGRIERVESLIDTDAIRRQLTAPSS